MSDEAKPEKCPFCGSRRMNLKTVTHYVCHTFVNKAGKVGRGSECYENELRQVKAQRDGLCRLFRETFGPPETAKTRVAYDTWQVEKFGELRQAIAAIEAKSEVKP